MTLVNYPGLGCIVEYMEANTLQIALVLEEQGSNLRLLLPNRRETRMNANRLLPWSGPIVADIQGARDTLIKILQTHKAKRQELSANLNALEMWDMANGEVEQATAKWFAELYEESPTVDTIAAYGHVLMQCKSHFKFQPPHFEIYTQETVERRILAQEEARRRESLITGGANFFRLLWDVSNKKCNLPDTNDNRWAEPQVLEYLEDLIKKRVADPENIEDSNTWNMLVKGLPDLQHLPLQLGMAWGIFPPHYNFWLDRADYNTNNDWAVNYDDTVQDIIKSVQDVNDTTIDYPFISIDSATTRDIDDAFFVQELENNITRLHLALACPALLWPYDSPFDKAILHRATSIYLPEATYHMMPEALGTDALSLVANTLRPALCISCDVDAEGQILNCTPSIHWVKLAANLCYDDCENVINTEDNTDNPASSFAKQLQLGLKLATTRQAKRIADGAVIMDKPENKVLLQGEGENTKVSIEEIGATTKAQMLVAEMMILASTAIAKWSEEQGISLLYRTQDVAIPREYAGIWKEPHQMARIMRSLRPSILETKPRPHAGLALSSYAPITSPLRRYPDLVNEAQIVHVLLHGKARYDHDNLAQMLIKINIHLDAAGQVQRFRPRYWRLLYVRQQGDKVWWDGVVTEENDSFAMISVPFLQIMVRGKRNIFGERACPGQLVKVRLGKVNALYNEISILEVEEV